VINISPKGVNLPPRIQKLIGVKAQAGSILISIARSAFADCGVSKTDRFLGASLQERGSYMMLRIDEPVGPRDVAPMIARFLNAYVSTVGRRRS
jgi:hypothetical protein